MNSFHVTRRARQDLIAIWTYIATRSGAAAADRVLAAIHDAIQALAEQPGMGHTRADVQNPRYRFWTVHNFVIAYHFTRKPLTVARVVHGARDFRTIFG